MLVTMQDIRAAKMCSRGARAFCVRHGLDWSELIKNGLDDKLIEATGDAMAIRLVEVARERRR
jgi:hypothetical protein